VLLRVVGSSQSRSKVRQPLACVTLAPVTTTETSTKPTTTTALRGSDLVLGYHRTTVVHGVSVEMTAGAVTALIGPNGSGKSTVLRSLARLHKRESGQVYVDGADATPLSAKEFARRVTLLAQSRPHPSGLGVRDVGARSPERVDRQGRPGVRPGPDRRRGHERGR